MGDNFLPIKFAIFLSKSCEPFRPVYQLHSPQGPILGNEARKREGLRGLEGTELGRESLGVEPQPGPEPGEDQAARQKEGKGPK